MPYLDDFIAKLSQPACGPPTTGVLPPEPAHFADCPAFERELVVVPPPSLRAATLSLAAARELLGAAISSYLALPAPPHMLLVRAAPGTGRTHRAVRTAEALAAQGRRVLYAGPRHAFFADVLALAGQPGLWWEWLPRQAGNPDQGRPETCCHSADIAGWIAKGYDGMSFCKAICGQAYVDRGCPWHGQKRQGRPIIFGQHAHVLSHPLRFHAVIGDESPIATFLDEWAIPAKSIVPQSMDPANPFTQLLQSLASLTLDGYAQRAHAHASKALSGPALIDRLGGPQRVLDACQGFTARPDALPLAPVLREAEDAAGADYFHLPCLAGLLRQEAHAHLAGQDYPGRVVLSPGRLALLRRRPASDALPLHVVWLDATGNARLYEVAFGRPVEVVDALPELHGRVVQVWSRTNGKHHTAGARAIQQLADQVATIARRYRCPAIITYRGLAEKVAPALPALHFYAARGTNAFETCDALIVAGTPMPSRESVHRTACMLFAERMEPFDPHWTPRLCPYAYVDPSDGQGRAYPVGGFWEDPDLQALLWSLREAELIQAAHRVRPILREVDVWLLSNLPLPELPPAQLLSLHELLAAPGGVNRFKWHATLQAIEACAEELFATKGYDTVADLARMQKIAKNTAQKYLRLLAETGRWVLGEGRERKRGRPGIALYQQLDGGRRGAIFLNDT